jgi:hypothetical protein
MDNCERIETLAEITVGDFFAEVVRGLDGIYVSLNKKGSSLCLTLHEASYLRTLILQAVKEMEGFDSEPE